MTWDLLLTDLSRALIAILTFVVTWYLKQRLDENWSRRRELADAFARRAVQWMMPLALLGFAGYTALMFLIPGAPSKTDIAFWLVSAMVVPVAVTMRFVNRLAESVERIIGALSASPRSP